MSASPSLYARYVHEREGFETVETPKGFATFQVQGRECYLRDIYVLPEARKHGEAARITDRICDVAREQGCDRLIGTISTTLPGKEASLRALLAYGFNLHSAHEGYLVLTKPLREGHR